MKALIYSFLLYTLLTDATQPMEKISVLGLDVGSKRIGVAGCDGLGLIATGLATIERKSWARDLERLRQIVEEREVQRLVVGLPYTMGGKLGFQARQVRSFARKVSAALQLPVEYADERLTSVEAREQMKASGRSPSRHKAAVDRIAAAMILQQWLDERRAGQPEQEQRDRHGRDASKRERL